MVISILTFLSLSAFHVAYADHTYLIPDTTPIVSLPRGARIKFDRRFAFSPGERIYERPLRDGITCRVVPFIRRDVPFGAAIRLQQEYELIFDSNAVWDDLIEQNRLSDRRLSLVAEFSNLDGSFGMELNCYLTGLSSAYTYFGVFTDRAKSWATAQLQGIRVGDIRAFFGNEAYFLSELDTAAAFVDL